MCKYTGELDWVSHTLLVIIKSVLCVQRQWGNERAVKNLSKNFSIWTVLCNGFFGKGNFFLLYFILQHLIDVAHILVQNWALLEIIVINFARLEATMVWMNFWHRIFITHFSKCWLPFCRINWNCNTGWTESGMDYNWYIPVNCIHHAAVCDPLDKVKFQ